MMLDRRRDAVGGGLDLCGMLDECRVRPWPHRPAESRPSATGAMPPVRSSRCGGGCSTESGIPDYRGGGRTGPRDPIQHDAFLRRADVRRRYWARATLGWERFRGARPNAAHRALASMEAAGALVGVITQNVDGLHQQAGSRRVVELHGALGDVRCLACRTPEPRATLQERLLRANPGWVARARAELAGDAQGGVRPDGDAELSAGTVAPFALLACLACGGSLKPEVVSFGGTAPEATLAPAWQ